MPVTDPISQARITEALTQLAARRPLIDENRTYLDGSQGLKFLGDKWDTAFGTRLKKYKDNVLPTVVSALVADVVLQGFKPRKGSGDDPTLDIVKNNRLKQTIPEVIQEAVEVGDGYLILDKGPDGKALIYPQNAEQVYVAYSYEYPGRREWAVKVWIEADNFVRLNLYDPNTGTEKYITDEASSGGTIPTDTKGFSPRIVEGEAWPLPPAVPGKLHVYHVGNRAKLGQMGRSEIEQVKPMQDAINKAGADLLVAMEDTSFLQRWMTGGELTDDDGNPVTIDVPALTMLISENDNAKYGAFPDQDLEKFLKVIVHFSAQVARTTRTPLDSFQLGGAVQETATKTRSTNRAHSAKCEALRVAAGNVFEELFMDALELEGQVVELEAVWEDPDALSDSDKLALVQQAVDTGIPLVVALVDYLDKDQDTAEAIVALAAEEASAKAGLDGLTFDRGLPAVA